LVVDRDVVVVHRDVGSKTTWRKPDPLPPQGGKVSRGSDSNPDQRRD
jgi:hypothetical protein